MLRNDNAYYLKLKLLMVLGVLVAGIALAPEEILIVFLSMFPDLTRRRSQDITFCFQQTSLPHEALQHTFFNTTVAAYFDQEQGILSASKVGTEYNPRTNCMSIPYKQHSKLKEDIEDNFNQGKILYVGENHSDIFSIRTFSGKNLINTVLRDVLNLTLFLEGDTRPTETKSLQKSDRNREVIFLDTQKYNVILNHAIFLLPSIYNLDEVDGQKMQNYCPILILYASPADWQLLEKYRLTMGEKTIKNKILQAYQFTAGTEKAKYTNEELIPFIYKDTQTLRDTASLLIKFMHSIEPFVEPCITSERKKTQKILYEQYKNKVLNPFLYSPSSQKSWDSFNQGSTDFVVIYRNNFFVDIIEEYLHNYIEKHGRFCPRISVHCGSAHIETLKKLLDPLYSSLCENRMRVNYKA